MKISLILFIILFYGKTFSSENALKIVADINITAIGSPKICINETNNCISGEEALTDLFINKNISIFERKVIMFQNYGMVGRNLLVGLNSSGKYNDGKYTYAIFISQSHKLNSDGVPFCHACAPSIGMAIYQFRDKWELFALNNNITQLGSYGNLLIYDENFKIIAISDDKFLVEIDSADIGQGYYSNNAMIFGVNYKSPTVKAKSGNTASIKYLGNITISESSCLALPPDDEWDGELSFNTAQEYGTLTATLKKRLKRCGKEGNDRTATDIFKHDAKKNEFIKINKNK
jgi:hypothetical protein